MSDIKTLDSIANKITRCPECEGTNLNTANTKCFDCSASDYS